MRLVSERQAQASPGALLVVQPCGAAVELGAGVEVAGPGVIGVVCVGAGVVAGGVVAGGGVAVGGAATGGVVAVVAVGGVVV
jgi:hypothetical protein